MKKSFFFLLTFLGILLISSIAHAALNKVTGTGYFVPDASNYKANFTIDVSKDGLNPAYGLVKYNYIKTRTSMISTAISDVSILGIGKTASITGNCKVNNIPGYTFIINVVDGSPDTYQLVIKRPDNTNLYSVGPKNVIGSINVSDTVLPNISITSPQNLITVAASPIQVSGTIDDLTAVVTVNGVPASVSGGSFYVSGITLSEGMNTIAAKAIDPANNMSTASVNISLDSTPPQVSINSPPDGYTTIADSIDVTGIINDIVRGTVNENQGIVSVNGYAAEIANRNFTARSIPLLPGSNTIRADGSDQWGNLASNSITVNRDITPRVTLNMESGNGQSGFIGSTIPTPLTVSLKNSNNHPIANETVVFRVVDNNGTLWDSVSGTGVRILAVLTDSAGLAGASFTLGSWAGSGNNRVEVSATGVEGTVFFIASGLMKPPAAIYVAQGSQQRGAVNQLLPEPLVAFVTDEGHNPLRDVPVIFRAVEGGGRFPNGLDTLTVNSDSDGRATVGFVLGPTAGNDGNTVEATFNGNAGPAAAFTATGLVPGDAGNTRISGVVLDNSNNPIRNVTMRVEGTPPREALTDANGVFLINNVPVGPVHLIADGSTAGQPGVLEYPTLMYEITTVSGADNKVSMPIYLVPLDLANSHEITGNETADIVYTLDEVPGFLLRIKPGSATFPDGTKHGRISVTQVHADKVPMVPQIGQQPRFIVTIQPPGTVFDPPAPITIPNVDGLAPGEKTNMYSFDHDLGVFVSIGTGTVSDDGLVIMSDLGVGVVKAGWHCGGNPAPTGSANNCPECQKCDNNRCIPDPAKNNQPCKDDGNGCTIDKCNNGVCEHKPLTVQIQNEAGILGIGARDSSEFMAKGYSTVQGDPADGAPDPAKIFYKIDPADAPLSKVELKINNGAVRTMALPAAAGEQLANWDGKNDAGQYVAVGAYTAVIEVTIQGNTNPCRSNVQGVRVVEVNSVMITAVTGGGALDANSHPAQPGGLRIFAERPDTGFFTSVNDKVEILAMLPTAIPAGQMKVYLRSYDVDDPTGLINANHAYPGGIFGIGAVPVEGKLDNTEIDPNGDNRVKTNFYVTRQPGDNFKVLASFNRNFINNLTDAIIEANINNRGDTTHAVLQPLSTDRLTIWRRFHIEVDSFGAVAGNVIAGNITNVVNNGNGTSTITTNQNFSDVSPANGDNRFVQGRLRNGGNTFTVTANNHGANFTVTVNNNGATLPVNGAFTLVDDDDFNGSDAANPDGDAGEDVTAPDRSLLQDSDDGTCGDGACNVYAYAYVRPTYDIGDNNNSVAFVLNTADGANEDAQLLATYDFDNVGTEASETFWTVYLLGAYQMQTEEDCDADDCTFGQVDNINGQGASVFMEVIRAGEATITAVVNNAATTAHEIGHLFNGEHADLGLMSQSGTRATLLFSDTTIRRIRNILHP